MCSHLGCRFWFRFRQDKAEISPNLERTGGCLVGGPNCSLGGPNCRVGGPTWPVLVCHVGGLRVPVGGQNCLVGGPL